jgi:hypothetical protein
VVRAHPTVPFSMLKGVLRLVSVRASRARSCLMRGLPERHVQDFAACATPSHDLSSPSAGALLARIACCGRPRSASRAAQPLSSAARAVFFAIGSWTLYGDAAG